MIFDGDPNEFLLTRATEEIGGKGLEDFPEEDPADFHPAVTEDWT
jgi:hypothetical protein